MTAPEAKENDPAAAKPGPLKRVLVGHVWIDSGLLVLTDPEYLEDLDRETLAETVTRKKRAGLFQEGMAAVFRSGLRNSRYPVYVTSYENGALVKIEIEMSETPQS